MRFRKVVLATRPPSRPRKWRRVLLAARLAYAAMRGRTVTLTVHSPDDTREFWGIPR